MKGIEVRLRDGLFLNVFMLGSHPDIRRLHEKETWQEDGSKEGPCDRGGQCGGDVASGSSIQSLYPYEVIGLIDDIRSRRG